MLKSRIIPCLLLRDGGLTKTEKFKKGKYIGDPINAVRIFNDLAVDELIFLDIDASKHKVVPAYDVIRELTSECFMPFAYGGGISTAKQIEQILKIGVEKIVINKIALDNRDFVAEAVKQFGSSTIIVGIDVKKNFLGKYFVYDHVKTQTTNEQVIAYAKEIESLGAGEIFVNNVDRDGVCNGYDTTLISQVSKNVGIPVIACGGAATIEDFGAAVKSGASAAAAGSIFVYQGPHKAVLISYPNVADLEKVLK
ncbi:AglZ/HisF2 family acetamidino modification protein [Chitinophaga sp.]|uniref:AglZ/HisF2 family acetamidino modification protein n=1 Tax=Chitinophaga sp. TaxID=1869181 RepID=UPI0031E22F4E